MKGILLAVSGLSPQVLTETLYALHQNGKSVHAVHVITTRTGKERIFGMLLSGAEGAFHQYLSDYGFNPSDIVFGDETIHVLKRANGTPIDDIVTQEDNEILLRECLQWAHHFTSDPDTAVYFSIAGGRKTMSACLTLAAQFYGRPCDRLYHVLVTPEFESSREFFYPPPESRIIILHDAQNRVKKMESRDAEVILVPIPFVSIRDRLREDLLQAPMDPGTLMSALIQEEFPRLLVVPGTKTLVYGRIEIDLRPAWMALYLFLIRHKLDYPCNGVCVPGCTDCFLDIDDITNQADVICNIYRRIGTSRPLENPSNTGIYQLDAANFTSYKSKIKIAIEKHVGPDVAELIQISSIGARPYTRYGIRMPRERIELPEF